MKSILCRTAFIGIAVICTLLISLPEKLNAQYPVQQFNTLYLTSDTTVKTYTAYPTNPGSFSACAGNNYTYNWKQGTENQLKLISFTANSQSYVIGGFSTAIVKIRRVNNANVNGNRSIVYAETTVPGATTCVSPRVLDFKVPYNDDMASFLSSNVLNQGTDNLFTNSGNGDGNVNNIERMDVVFPNGIANAIPSDVGFILCERGNNNAHDGFRITAILSIDANNNPTSFGQVKTCVAGNGSNNGSWGHPSIANGNKQFAAYILRKESNETNLRVSSNVNQEMGGVFFSLASLGIASEQVIYGYSLIGPDGVANPSTAQLLNLNDATVYPTNTTEAQGGGLDLIAVNTYFGTGPALASPYITSFGGRENDGNILVNWTLQNLPPGKIISLERSADGTNFTTILEYHYQQENNGQFQDIPGKGLFYYRIKIRDDLNPAIAVYSQQIRFYVKNETPLFIYPTIAKAGQIITIDNLTAGDYMLTLADNSGREIFSQPLQVTASKIFYTLPQQLRSGSLYFFILTDKFRKQKKIGKILVAPG